MSEGSCEAVRSVGFEIEGEAWAVLEVWGWCWAMNTVLGAGPLQVIRVEEGDLHGTLKVSRVAEMAPRDSAGRSSGSGLAGGVDPRWATNGTRLRTEVGYEWALGTGGRERSIGRVLGCYTWMQVDSLARGASGFHKSGNGVCRLLDLLASGLVGFLRGIDDAVVHMVFKEPERNGVKG